MTWTKDEFEKLYARFTESGLSIRFILSFPESYSSYSLQFPDRAPNNLWTSWKGKHSANPVLQMSQSILWKLWRFSEILVEVWRNCWSLSETVGDEFRSSLFPWVLLGGSCPEVSTGHCHTHGCVPGNSSSTFGNLHLPPCSIPSWCRWWLHPRLHRHCHRRDSSSGRWLSDVRCSWWDYPNFGIMPPNVQSDLLPTLGDYSGINVPLVTVWNVPPEMSRFSEANDVTLFCLIDSTLLCVKDQGTVPDSCLSCEFSILWEGFEFIKWACGDPCFRLLRMILLIRTLLFPYFPVFSRFCQRFFCIFFASFKFILIFAFEIIPYEIAITSFS